MVEPLADLPGLADLLAVLPETDREPREERSAERGGVDHARPLDGHAEQVRLELHEQVVLRGAAVHLEHRVGLSARAHGLREIVDEEGDALERGAREVRRGDAPVDPADDARASGRQCGAPSPASAGTNTRSPVSFTCRERLDLPVFLNSPSPSRSHCTAAPAMKEEPSSA